AIRPNASGQPMARLSGLSIVKPPRISRETKEKIMSKLHELADLGQSIWLDYMHRDMLDSGELNQLRVIGVRGVTSNPAIFEKAIAQSDTYDNALRILAAE